MDTHTGMAFDEVILIRIRAVGATDPEPKQEEE
jgi:hypothetical protein